MQRNRSYNYTFTVHNQGTYDPMKKTVLLHELKKEFNMTGYIIVQELYPNADKTNLDPEKLQDSHLQGNLYFKNQVSFSKVLQFFKKLYPETQTDNGLIGRTQILPIRRQQGKSIKAMDYYFMGLAKVGGDPEPLSNMELREQLQEVYWLQSETNRMLKEISEVLLKRKLLRQLSELPEN